MQYRLRGEDHDTGSPVDTVIDAPDEAGARNQASSAGLMVETLAEVATASATAATTAAYAVQLLATVSEHGLGGPSLLRSKLETMLNEMAGQGWEFVAVETVPAKTLAGSGGRGRISGEDVVAEVSLVVFRRASPASPMPATNAPS